MSSNNLSFKKNAYKTIDVEYKFSPFYSYYILNNLIDIILKYDESERTILNEYFDTFKTQYDTNIELNNIISMIFDGESETQSTIPQIEGKLKKLTYSNANRLKEFELEPNTFSDSFKKYCYLLFEDKYNFSELLKSNEIALNELTTASLTFSLISSSFFIYILMFTRDSGNSSPKHL